MAIVEPGSGDDWRPAPRFAPLDGDSTLPVARSRIVRMPTLGLFAVARLARRMKARLLARRREKRSPGGGA